MHPRRELVPPEVVQEKLVAPLLEALRRKRLQTGAEQPTIDGVIDRLEHGQIIAGGHPMFDDAGFQLLADALMVVDIEPDLHRPVNLSAIHLLIKAQACFEAAESADADTANLLLRFAVGFRKAHVLPDLAVINAALRVNDASRIVTESHEQGDLARELAAMLCWRWSEHAPDDAALLYRLMTGGGGLAEDLAQFRQRLADRVLAEHDAGRDPFGE